MQSLPGTTQRKPYGVEKGFGAKGLVPIQSKGTGGQGKFFLNRPPFGPPGQIPFFALTVGIPGSGGKRGSGGLESPDPISTHKVHPIPFYSGRNLF